MSDEFAFSEPSEPTARKRKRFKPVIKIPKPPAWIWGLVLLFLLGVWIWFFWRIEPVSDQIAVLIRKTGRNLPSGQILAVAPGGKGIQLDVLSEGRYFYNPYSWGWKIKPITDIPAGKLGVLIRLYGKDLPAGKILAEDGSKGIVEQVLRPGKYRINPYAYSVQQFDALSIRPGHVGVVTSLIGEDVMDGNLPPEKRNTYLVDKGMKGVLPTVLDPGTYYLNPYVVSVVEMTLQSQRFEMSGDDAINFLTVDGFTVVVEGTIEYAVAREQSALLTHQVGDMEDIVKKIVLPRARGFSRIEGSKNPAIAYIVGETRQQFQNNLEQHLKDRCEPWGVNIKSVLIRNISPPDQIAAIIRDREVAVQTARMFDRQIEQARSKAELTKQEMLARQNKEKVESETEKIRAVILAQQGQEVRLTSAMQELEVARLENEAATFQAEAMMLEAAAEREVIGLQNEAVAGVLRHQVSAFDSGLGLARYALYTTLAPRIESLLTTDQSEGLGGIFHALGPESHSERSLFKAGKEASNP